MIFRYLWIVAVILGLSSQVSCAHKPELTDMDKCTFLESFVKHYEFNPEGRYTHEYHPFLLQWTASSLDRLEDCLIDKGFDLSGRIIIMGYEEQAVPQYYTDFKRSKINDEATRKNNAGWSLRLHNRFGFMTGFLFKDLPYITTKYFPSRECVYQHVDADLIPIFNDHAVIFHEHAFGQALPLIRREQEVLLNKLVHDDEKDVLKELALFWETLYSRSLKVGNHQVAGTQDVLFSIEYAKHLTQSPLPLFKFFIGPDITYPIEVTVKHDKLATLHAQNFITELTQKLQPINDSNTVYVFCSFVDGVGKSTMLGNIKNWMNFGLDVEKFEHVDNSSSQLCELFKCKDKVFVADLPAQVSHFTYKPDGSVFVDARTHYSKAFVQELEQFVLENKVTLQADGRKLFSEVKNIIKQDGYEALVFHDPEKPFFAFAKNVILLHKDETSWIPFCYKNQEYLFKDGSPLEIRYLTRLGTVKSEGLKNIESEQMLFFEGIRFPLPYSAFLDDLVAQFKTQNIQKVVFVDFLSMYPRSSRENVRINYLLQQMALLRNQFQPRFSLYKDFVSGGELLHTLLSEKSALQIRAAFEQEALVRLALFNVLITRTEGDVTGIKVGELTGVLNHECEQIIQGYQKNIMCLVDQKITRETRELEKVYGLSKSFVNIQQFSLSKACMFSGLLQKFFTNNVDHQVTNEVWGKIGGFAINHQLKTDGERLQSLHTTNSGDTVKAHFIFHPDCKNEILLAPFLRSVRASWYASILNLMTSSITSPTSFSLTQELHKVVPIQVVQGSDGFVYALAYHHQPWQKNITSSMRSDYRLFNLLNFKPTSYALIADQPYRIDWENRTTSEGVFGYDCKLNKDKSRQYQPDLSVVSTIVQEYQNEHGQDQVIPTQDLWQALMDDQVWHYEHEDLVANAMRNGAYKNSEKSENKSSGSAWGMSKKVYYATHEHKVIARVLIRLLATLEMVVKDPESDIVVRDRNRDDFKAALKLFEQVVLPTYSGLVFLDDLFDDYDDIEPFPSWDYWDDRATQG